LYSFLEQLYSFSQENIPKCSEKEPHLLCEHLSHLCAEFYQRISACSPFLQACNSWVYSLLSLSSLHCFGVASGHCYLLCFQRL
jgi:hypothetical protein